MEDAFLYEPPSLLPRARLSIESGSRLLKPRRSVGPEASRISFSRPSISRDQVASAIESSEAFRHMTDHWIPLEELLQKLRLDDLNQGLNEAAASKRLLEEGENVLKQKPVTPWYFLLLKQLTGFFALLLWCGSVLSYVAYDLTDDIQNLYLSVVIALVVLVTSLISFYQEMQSRAIMEGFKNVTPPKCTVLRDGLQRSLKASRLVRGDVVLLKAGDRIPADIRIVQSYDMKVENAALTGESEHLVRSVNCTHPENPLESQNLAFLGTLCVDGTGAGVVIAVGDRTCMGRIAHLAQVAETEDTTLSREIARFVKMISFVAFGIGLLFFILGALQGHSVLDCLIYMIGIIVANVPEGLLATVTVGLTLTAKRMAGKNVLVKNLESVETLGSITCICSDKTGTLTQNRMTVTHMWYDQRVYDAPSLEHCDKPPYDTEAPTFQLLHRCAVLCNEAVFDMGVPASVDLTEEEKSQLTPQEREKRLQIKQREYTQVLNKKPYSERPTTSNASEGSLIKFFQPIRPIEETRDNQDFLYCGDQKICVPFNSTIKHQVSVHLPAFWQGPSHRDDLLLLVKGAPEVVLEKCSHYVREGESKVIDLAWKQDFQKTNAELGKLGERVLGFAYRFLSGTEFGPEFEWDLSPPNFPIENLSFIGLIGLQDPPREGVAQAVQTCQNAGIKVIMVTGDQPVTALSIARQCNIVTHMTANELAEKRRCDVKECLDECEAVVVHGSDLAKAAAADKAKPSAQRGEMLQRWLTKKEVVFARTTPAQKLIIVEGCQKIGHIVAVTGDGVNDSPAIKKADIGIAMGVVGSDVAKDAADMLLLDDNFSSIVSGVEEGRLLFDNLKKTIVYMLASNIPELGPFLSFILFQFPLPLTIVLVLFVDLCTDMLPAVSLAYEPAEMDIMRRLPRDAEVDHLVTWRLLAFGYAEMGVIEMFAGFLAYFQVMHDYGFSISLLFGLALNNTGAEPLKSDLYNSSDPYKGNTQWNNPEVAGKLVDWVSDKTAPYDLRVWFYNSGPWGDCLYDSESPVVPGVQYCYSTEALKAAQTAFFLATIAAQFCNLLCLKTRTLSISQHRQSNIMTWWGVFVEFGIGLLLTYVPVFNRTLATRPLEWPHVFLPAAPFCVFLVLFDEGRKWQLRRGSGWLEKFTLW